MSTLTPVILGAYCRQDIKRLRALLTMRARGRHVSDARIALWADRAVAWAREAARAGLDVLGRNERTDKGA